MVPSGVAIGTEVRRSRWNAVLAVYALVAVAVVGFAFSNDWFQGDDRTSTGGTTTSTILSTTTTAVPTEVPPIQWLATPHGEVPKYDAPGGAEIGVAGFWYGYPMTMPILERVGEWLHVMTPERPNGSSAWIRADQADISSSAYRIVIRLAETKVIVYKDGYRLHEMPAGLGKASTPTPPGHSFVAVKEIPGPPGYGPVVLDLSAHSEAIQSWQGSGDAIIALHGPISASSAARIGTTGTYISNGCVRLHEADQIKLMDIPLGTPVDIV